MIPGKTPAGQQVLKDRTLNLTPRQRAALILIDGKRSLADVLQSSGAGREDVERLFELQLVSGALPKAQPAAAAKPPGSPQERYQAAYPIATRLTASLGLRGVRLNLAVEAAGSYDDLLALAPRIRDAVGADQFAPLGAALGQR
jgi:hypothetical protein